MMLPFAGFSRRHTVHLLNPPFQDEEQPHTNDGKEERGKSKKEIARGQRRSTLAHILLGDNGTTKAQAQIPNIMEGILPVPQRKRRSLVVGLFQPRSEEAMRPKIMHVVVLGTKRVGKSTMLAALLKRNPSPVTSLDDKDYTPTMEDTVHVQLNSGRPEQQSSSREIIEFHDTAGLSDFGAIEVKKPYLQVADAFVLVYSVSDSSSFSRIDILKKYLDREKSNSGKDKREIPIVVVGTKMDLPGRQVATEFAIQWANRERVKLFEVSASDRDSIVEVVHFLSGKFFNTLKETKFSLSRRLKPERSNAQIVMDF